MKLGKYSFIDRQSDGDDLLEELLQSSRVGFDYEATGLDPVSGIRTLMLQLSNEKQAYVFDARKVDVATFKPLLESKEVLKIGHNLKYEYKLSLWNHGVRPFNLFDTMLAYRILTCGKDYVVNQREKGPKRIPYKSLDFLCNKYLGITLNKDITQTFINFPQNKDFSAAQIEYAADDVLVLHTLCDILSAELEEAGLLDVALLEFKALPAVSEMELNGVSIDKEKWREIIGGAKKMARKFEQAAKQELEDVVDQNTLFGVSGVDLDSPKQLLEVLRKKGLEIQDTNAGTLENCNHPIAKLITQYRGYSKLVGTYGENLLSKINRNSNRLHFTLVQIGADTGRFSSENPNIQNIPNDKEDKEEDIQLSFRECFIAPPGRKILTSDLSQAELRILAQVSKDKEFMRIFMNDLDLHMTTAQQVFKFSDKDAEAYKKLEDYHDKANLLGAFSATEVESYKSVGRHRKNIKAINFGIPYGLSAWGLANRLKTGEDDARTMLEDYFRVYRGIKQWLDKHGKECVINRHSKTILGRKRFYEMPNPNDGEDVWQAAKRAVIREANNHTIQGTNCDIVKNIMFLLWEAYLDLNAKLLFTVHDEIVSECDEKDAPQVAAVKAELMRKGFHIHVPDVPVGKKDKVGVAIGDYWSK